MLFLFSGEGPTDCGVPMFSDRICTGENFQPGPMMVLASQIVEGMDGYSPLDSACCGLVARTEMNAVIDRHRHNWKSAKLPGRRRAQDTQYFQRAARALARLAVRWSAENHDDVVAILFRDNDDHQSTPASLWTARKDAVYAGFKEEGFARGVAMIPRPTSEAWLLCALKERPYEQCEALEERSGSPNSKRPLKKELAEILGTEPTRELLCELVTAGKIDSGRIAMPSFTAFRELIEKALV